MIDREKVISGLEHCRRGPIGCQQECPYKSDFGCRSQLAADALALLKEQEPVTWSHDGYNCFVCSDCGLCMNDEVYYMMDKPIQYCPSCGRKVKLDE